MQPTRTFHHRPLILIRTTANPTRHTFRQVLLMKTNIRRHNRFVRHRRSIHTRLILSTRQGLNKRAVYIAVREQLRYRTILIRPNRTLLTFHSSIIQLRTNRIRHRHLFRPSSRKRSLRSTKVNRHKPVPIRRIHRPTNHIRRILTQTLRRIRNINRRALHTRLLRLLKRRNLRHNLHTRQRRNEHTGVTIKHISSTNTSMSNAISPGPTNHK